MKTQKSILFIGIVISILLFYYTNKNIKIDNKNKNIQILTQVKDEIKIENKDNINKTNENLKKIYQKKEKYSFNKKESQVFKYILNNSIKISPSQNNSLIFIEKESQISHDDEVEKLMSTTDTNIQINNNAFLSDEDTDKINSNQVLNANNLDDLKEISDLKENKPTTTNKFYIKNIKLNNIVLLKKEVYALKSKYENSEFSNEKLLELVKELNNLYLENGYVTTRVKVKVPQDLKTGVLELDVINGYIEDIVQNKNTLRNKLSVFSAFPMMKNEILNLKDIEQGIKQINGLSSNNAKMKILPGEKYETSKIEITTEKSKAYSLNFTYDNLGEKSTGTHRGALGVGINDLIGMNDSLYFSYKNNLEGEKDKYLKEYNGNFSFPLGYYKISMIFSNSKTLNTVDGNINKIEYRGKTEKNKFEIKKDIFNKVNGNGYIKTALEFVKGRNYVGDVELFQSKKDLRIGSIEIGRTYKYEKGYLSSSLSYDKGLTIFDGTDNEKSKFNKYMINLSGTNLLNWMEKDFYYDFQLSGQYSKDIMYSSEKMSIGDLYTVRGFKENSISGEQGIYLKNNLTYRMKSKKPILKNSQIFLGMDIGLTKDLSYESDSKYDEIEKVSGVSLGYQYNAKNLNLDLTLAKPIIQPDYFEDEKYNIYLTSTISY
ncbi:MAG: ShlB/FhaC/HecB family hemolysin secretion/activation protein [Fusobacteriaceae bacterium]|nr:ShlB/FhaC/HecB family hemolysin secretion/activation protein [Fusobacteriaceae bacterium]